MEMKKMFRSIWLSSLLGLTASCASTAGARPHDMSAAQHEREGQAHSAAAVAQASQYDPNATVERSRCSPRGGPRAGGEFDGACWTSASNPTAEHTRAAADQRRQAAEHRAASAALRDAEARACVGIHPDDRDTSPFEHIEDIERVEPLVESTGPGSTPTRRTVGAIIAFRTVSGMTGEWLQRVVDCHIARNDTLGHLGNHMPNCPLVPHGAQAHVTSTRSGIAVAIRSDNPTTASEILARAERLRHASVSPVQNTR